MRSGKERLALGAGLLAGLWIAVYWLWPVEREPAITFADEPAPVSTSAEPAPIQRPIPTDQPPPPQVAERPAQQPTGVIAPQFATHTVRAGETFQSIARARYGDSALWSVIGRANPRVDPEKLRPGVELRIPIDPRNVQGLPTEDAPTIDVAAKPVEYIVRSGDTLGEISKTYYGTTALWEIILDANRTLISRPQDLRPGMRLLIPPNPRGAGSR